MKIQIEWDDLSTIEKKMFQQGQTVAYLKYTKIIHELTTAIEEIEKEIDYHSLDIGALVTIKEIREKYSKYFTDIE